MIHAYDPRTGETFGEGVPEATDAVVDAAVEAAHAAGPAWRAASRAEVLEAVAAALEANVEELWQVADRETALGETRLRGEVARAAGQFRLFADVLRDGGHLEAVISTQPDVRRMNQPLPGVVGVFSASNFPFAFSVAGGDTASALAAGCPVVVKAHPAHPLTSELSAKVIRSALPDPALLGLVHGLSAGKRLVQHPHVVAVGFTGSIPGGKAIQALIDERPDPIPFYGELGSVNPVVVLPSAAREGLADGFAASLTLGTGQFCTNPGLVFAPDDADLIASLGTAVAGSNGSAMLSSRIREGYLQGVERLSKLTLLAEGTQGEGEWAVAPKVFTIDLAAFAAQLPSVAEECFGPSSIVVTYRDVAELAEVLGRLDGSLTATVHATDTDEARPVAEALARKAGRLIWNGWPTGVAVCWAMHHGGPWPSSTAPAHTSVGAMAIRRWLRPTAYQGWPQDLLPVELRDGNPAGIPQRVDS
ncbi:aldehyde dehydrogenase (NADP(+)) [Nonomuraea sp. NPDC059194]|uniref:aldehyde dehydrogenase (NADP(+)) n=1 Tax=Nonomuraea sp. NPDC059194 TaxID=3346764 RepID=UPI00368B8280